VLHALVAVWTWLVPFRLYVQHTTRYEDGQRGTDEYAVRFFSRPTAIAGHHLKKEGNASILRGRFVRGRSVRCSWAVKTTAVPKILRRHMTG
jgi:hypothetical protein